MKSNKEDKFLLSQNKNWGELLRVGGIELWKGGKMLEEGWNFIKLCKCFFGQLELD